MLSNTVKVINRAIRKLNHRRIDAGRALLLAIIKALFDRPFQSLPLKDVSQILVLRIDGKLGDCIVSTGFLAALHAAYPNAEITVLTGSETSWVYQTFSYIRVVDFKKGIIGTLSAFIRLNKISWDLIIDTSTKLPARSVFLVSQLPARRKIGFATTDFRLFSDFVQFDPNKDHITKRYLELLRMIGSSQASVDYVLPIPAEHRELADKSISGLNGKPYIVLNSFAGARFRCLSETTTKKLIHALLVELPDHVVVSVANKGDLRILERWQKQSGIERWIVFSECHHFYANCRLVERADAVISPDTAIIHMASAYKRPLVSIFRPDLGEEKNCSIWAPYQTKFKLINSQPGPPNLEQDINNLSIDSVVDALRLVMR